MATISEFCDTRSEVSNTLTSTGDAQVKLSEEQASEQPSEQEPIGTSSIGGESEVYRAIIFSTAKEKELEEYEIYLINCCFSIEYDQSKEAKDIQDKITATAAKGVKKLVVLVLTDNKSASELDQTATVLSKVDESVQKLLIYCRISNCDNFESADCENQQWPVQNKKKLRNSAILSIAVETRKLALDFVRNLREVQETCWLSKGIGHLIQYKITEEQSVKFNIKSVNGLLDEYHAPHPVVKLLHKELAKEFGEGAHLKALDPETVKTLKASEDPPADLVYCEPPRATKHALIIHNMTFRNNLDDRLSSISDYENLKHVFQLMSFTVEEKFNKTADEIHAIVSAFANTTEHGEACVLVIMSHGRLGGICGIDYDNGAGVGLVSEYEIINLMRTGENVRAKPRLVIIQGCRDVPVTPETRKSEAACNMAQLARMVGGLYGAPLLDPLQEVIPQQSGLIVAHCTAPGQQGFCSPYGSRFILALCTTLHKFAHKEDVVSMINRINFIMVRGFREPRLNGISQAQQMSSWTVETHKKFFLVSTAALHSSNP